MQTKVGYFIYFSKYNLLKNSLTNKCLRTEFYNKRKATGSQNQSNTPRGLTFCQ